MGMWITLIGLLCITFALLYWYFKQKYQFFKKLGINGPEPTIPLGNLTQVGQDGFLEPIKKWRQQYGSVFGYFEGPSPVIVVSDPDVIKSILVTDFNNFRERKPFPLVPNDPKGLFVANEQRWRWLRPVLSPSFTGRKVKLMSPSITNSIETLLEIMGEMCTNEADSPVDIHRLFQGLTLDVIGKVAFGFQTNSLRDPNDRMLMRTQKVFKQIGATVFHILAIIFPCLSGFLLFIKTKLVAPFVERNAFDELRQDLKEVIKLRKTENSTERADFLQLLINIQKEGKRPSFNKRHKTSDENEMAAKHGERKAGDGSGDFGEEENVHDIISEFTDDEIIAQAFTILLAGYETTANMLAFTAYLLALNPDVQTRVCEEIDTHIPTEADASCENTEKLPYLDKIVNEVLRMYSTAGLLVTRRSKEAQTYGSLHIPAQTNVLIDMWGLHYNPQHWPEPQKFDPERFSGSEKAKRHPYAFIPFGGGPRNCIGMRFALIEMKVVLVRILQKFVFEKSTKTEEPLSLRSKTAIVPKNGVFVEISRRS